jgi:predicted nuclease of predicted toxin-antitoxin system
MARIKVVEDLPRHIVEVAREHGHEATSVLGQGWQGTPDDTLWPRIQAEGRWLITADKAFGDLRRFAPGAHAGVIVVRCAQQNRRNQLHLASTVLDRIALDESAGAVVVVTERGIRIRRAPRRSGSETKEEP